MGYKMEKNFFSIKGDRGQTLILLALAIIVLFGFAALAIDVGHLYHVKDQLQVAADAAALAGAAELDGTNGTAQADARTAAQKIAAKNFADVADVAVAAFPPNSPGAAAGQPVPVALKPAQADGDIVVGFWDGTTFTAGGTPVNAIKVLARRNEDRDAGGTSTPWPKAENWFSKVFKLLGVNFSFTAISATAIAASELAPILPIAVNEYWDEVPGKPGGAYGQVYPQSFMRSMNADGITTGRGGQTFAVLGTAANSNDTSFNLNSFVDVLHRNRFHTPIAGTPGGTSAWWAVNRDTTTGTCSPNCGNNLAALPGGVTNGDVNPGKFDDNFTFLFRGIPDNVIPPNAVREIIRSTPLYPGDNYSLTPNHNDPSQCPYASIPYFSSSGGGPVVKKFNTDDALDGARFRDRYPDGSKFMVMVYDGTLTTNPDPSQANVVTVIGYGLIEVDGYKSGPFNGNPSSLGKSGNTAYGHAIKHGLAGADDEYLIQPSNTDRTPDCTFTEKLGKARQIAATVRLVGPNLKYGMAD